MSILINLLPDVRQAKLRERQRRQMVGGVSVGIWAVCGAVLVLLTIYEASQKVMIKQYTDRIDDNKVKLEQVDGLIDALTAQQHAASLPGLYDKRVYFTKFFEAYEVSDPTDIALNSMAVDSQNVLLVSGFGKTYASVAKLARALEAANIKVGKDAAETNRPYFSDVKIISVSNAAPRGINFTLSAKLEPGVTNGNN